MSQKKLSVIVTCTDRKAYEPSADLMVRNLPAGSVVDRSSRWRESLAAEPPAAPLTDLYQGETWAQVTRLVQTVQNAGFEPDLYVASAGLGLRHATFKAPAYAATFSPGHADTVASSASDLSDWWAALPHESQALGDTPAIWILSKTYSQVISKHLLARTKTDRFVVFGGSDEIPDRQRVPANRKLRSALGGTITSLNVRAAIKWVELAAGERLHTYAAREKFHTWAAAAAVDERYERQPVSDAEILDLIRQMRQRDESLSKTQALRQLRSAGLACEQKRFSGLYAHVVATR